MFSRVANPLWIHVAIYASLLFSNNKAFDRDLYISFDWSYYMGILSYAQKYINYALWRLKKNPVSLAMQ